MTGSVAVISDIHGNLEALQAVLADIESQGVTQIVCLGDIVGYGGNPAECVDLIRAAGIVTIKGNHDALVASDDDCLDVNELLRQSILWTRGRLTSDQRAWLAGLPLTMDGGDFEGVHASLREPAAWRYLLTPGELRLHFCHQVKPVCFVGHTHQPKFWVEGMENPVEITSIESLHSHRKQVVNVGSVGQPRDGDGRACYVIFRRNKSDIWWRRVPYDVASAQRAIIAAGMPARYAARLEAGK